jgi:CAAX prenyl protease-like protein
MAAFLLITQIGNWWPASYPIGYVAKTAIVAVMLVLLWPIFTKIRWDYWWVGAIMGIVGVVQWVGMENLLLHHWPNYPRMGGEPFDPIRQINSPAMRIGFIAVRLAGASVVVPVMEELFWRDFLWRTVLAPNDFKLAAVGEWDWKVWLIVAAAFSCVHAQWMTAFVWGAMIGGLLITTRSLGACIIMHGVTNFLLGLYVLKTGSWYFW